MTTDRTAYWGEGEARALLVNLEQLGRAADAATGPADYTLIAQSGLLLATDKDLSPDARDDAAGLTRWALERLAVLVKAGNPGPEDALQDLMQKARDRGVL